MDLIINGTSLSSLGVIVENQTRFTKPKRRTSTYYVDNKDGSNLEEYGYDAYTLSYNITLTDPTKFDQVYVLLDGEVVLETSDDENKIRYAKIIEEVEYLPLAIWKKATVNFYIEKPFRYIKTESNVTLLAAGDVSNVGTINSLPLIKITGSGVVVINIDDRSISYDFDTDHVFIDSETQRAYHSSSEKTNQMTGDFPYLTPGVNAITWTGSITEIIITPRSRFL